MTKQIPPNPGDTTPTMADLIERMLADQDLTDARRRNLASSIRRFCGALGIAPERAPAAFWFFRERLERFHPADVDIKPHRWQTIRADVAFALKRIGLAPDQPKPRVPLSGAWDELYARMKALGMKQWGLGRLARFCDARGIAPSAVTDAVMDDYAAFVREQTFRTKPHRHHRDVCRKWNGISAAAPDLQLQIVTLRSNREIYAPPWKDLPESFRAKAEAWLTSLSEEGDLLSEEGPNRPLRPASIKSYRAALRQVIGGLERSGRPLETIDKLGALVASDAAKAALRFHIDRTGGGPSQMLAQMAHVLVLIAKRVGTDDETIERLKRYRSRLSPPRRGLRPKPRKALRQFVDRGNIEKLLMLPQRIHERLRRKSGYTLDDARLMQVAVALELLLMRPIRRGNLVALRLGEHVLKVRNRTVIAIDGPDVKNRVDPDYSIPAESARMLDFYVERLLPLFGSNPQGFLFPGKVPGHTKAPEVCSTSAKATRSRFVASAHST